MIRDQASSVVADISTMNPRMASFNANAPFTDLIDMIITAILKALGGCSLSPAKALEAIQESKGLLGRYYDRQLSKIITKTIDDRETDKMFGSQIHNALRKRGMALSEPDVVEMMAEADSR